MVVVSEVVSVDSVVMGVFVVVPVEEAEVAIVVVPIAGLVDVSEKVSAARLVSEAVVLAGVLFVV